MIKSRQSLLIAAVTAAGLAGPAVAGEICSGYGPQTPRDIALTAGTNARVFALAGSTENMNLCNIHGHRNAEHKGPGFSVSGGEGEHGGWKCNGSDSLTEAEMAPAEGAMHGVEPGDTIEIHWVYTSCDITPGAGLGSCLSKACANPQLRVEAQVFLVVNDPNALDFNTFAYAGTMKNGLHQARALPGDTGSPVVFAGSTTGPKYTAKKCSPLQATWSVRPNCAKVDINSLHRWAENNVFTEDHMHGVRQIVKAPELLAPIQ